MTGTLVAIIQIVFYLFDLLLLARILLSWVQLDPNHPVVQFIYNATEPILAPIRRALPRTGTFDFSPIVAWIGAWILQTLLLQLLR